MSWLFLSLPLVISVSFLIISIVPPLILKEAVRDLKAPKRGTVTRDTETISEAFARVFGGGRVETVPEGKPEGSPVLLGTAVGSESMALLSIGGKTLILKEGEEKMGVTLKRVFRREVILEIDGREVRVKIRKFVPSDVSERRSPEKEVRIPRRELERITEDPGIMFREIRLVPFVKNGRTKGFIFEWIKPGSLFHRVGLRRGDVLLSINNVAINSAEDAFRVLQILRNEPSFRVVILRNGQRKEISVRID